MHVGVMHTIGMSDDELVGRSLVLCLRDVGARLIVMSEVYYKPYLAQVDRLEELSILSLNVIKIEVLVGLHST